MSVKRIAVISLASAVICVCSWITVPFFAVPFTMQTFAVFFALELLSGVSGTAAIGVYILLGAVGVPVFSGFSGGIGHLMGPTGGYIIGFLFSGLVYTVFQKAIQSGNRIVFISVRALALAVCYLIGTAWFMTVASAKGNTQSVWQVITVCVLPFIVPDAVKITLSIYVARAVKKGIKT